MVKDFRPITLIGSLYKIIAKILANRLVVVLGDIVNEVQSAFVANRQILDGPFILNEVFQWCKKKRKQSMIFKVYFEKAFDSVRWDYLDDVLKNFGFGDRWRGWIQSCLISSRGSVIVNGSPTREFQFHRGLKQGDPLSPFLFILIMESLHISVQRFVNAGLFRGVSIGPSLHLSHIFYADDAPPQRSSKGWNPFDVVFNGIETDSKKQTWIKWNKVLASKEKGGLGLSSFYALNRALMFKWVWRFRTQGSSLWAKVIKGIHGADRKLDMHVNNCHPSIWLDIVREVKKLKNLGIDLLSFIHKKLGNGTVTSFCDDVWRGDATFKFLYHRLFALESSKSITVAMKLSQDSLCSSFRRAIRGGVEQAQLSQLIMNMEGVSLVDMRDRWVWSLDGSGEFFVASVRRVIDDRSLPVVSSKTKWVNVVPIKVNIHAWKVRLDGLPTRLNISKRGMNIESISCPLCNNAVESSSHIFFACHIARESFRKITRWWDINFLEISSHEDWTEWISNLRLHSKHKKLLEGVCYVMWWHIWNFRNKSIFGAVTPSKASIFEDIVASSFHGTEAAEDRETAAETDGGQKIHVSLQKRRSSVLKEISSQVLDKWQLRQHVTTHSDIYNASSTDLSSPSSIATVIRGDQKQLYPHGLQKLPMNKRNSPLTPDAIETPSANVTSPEHTHAAQRRLRTITPDVYRQEKQPTMHHQQTIAPNVYQQKKQTTHQQQTNDTHIQEPQPDRQQQCLSYAETARTSDPKNTRPRYETPIQRRVRRRHALHTEPTYLHNSNGQGAAVTTTHQEHTNDVGVGTYDIDTEAANT
ncbi:RNA-directed DNA polymerase, eukaryota, reverse transcriptase zinc-binding domain protein [Tanacetum coccineum]